MADQRQDGRRDEDEPKIVVRDRRRVNLEGEVREVEDAAPQPEPVAESAEPTAPEPTAPEPSADVAEPTEEERIQQIRARRKARQEQAKRGGGGSALGGADQARVNRGPQLQDVDQGAAAEEAGDEDEAGAPRINNVYEYAQVLSSELMMWALASLGFMPQPGSGIVTTDQDQAGFALDAADSLLDTLLDHDDEHLDRVRAVTQSFVIQFGSIAAELLQQPPQSRLQDMSNIRFCIDAADRFAQKFEALTEAQPESEEATQIAQIKQFVGQLRLAYVQASGGGGIIG